MIEDVLHFQERERKKKERGNLLFKEEIQPV